MANLLPFPGWFDALDFSNGIAKFVLVIVTEFFTAVADTYVSGSTVDINPSHGYKIMCDGEIGAETNGNVNDLHLVEGRRGDSGPEVNGVIADP